MLIKGFRFGLLLQFAIGPVCLFILQTSIAAGFLTAEVGVLAVTIVDGLFILAAILGIAAIIDKKNVKISLKIFGSAVLLIFGLSTVMSQFGMSFLPAFSIKGGSSNVFIQTLFLTISNPLTIVFWAGVFSSKLTEENMGRGKMLVFGFGAVLSTFVFLSLIALLGSFSISFLPVQAIKIFNILVGIVLVCFGIKMAFKKVNQAT